MTKAEHKKQLDDINRQIAALDIAREIAINKRRELEGVYPSTISSKPGLSEQQITNELINSRRRRNINI